MKWRDLVYGETHLVVQQPKDDLGADLVAMAHRIFEGCLGSMAEAALRYVRSGTLVVLEPA